MLLTVQDLRRDFGLEKECEFLFHNKYCQGQVQVFGTFSGGSLIFKFDNKIDYFDFLVEAKNLIENNIWRDIRFSSTTKSSVSHKGIGEQESLCLEYSIDIDHRTQEILQQYISKNDSNLKREEVILKNIISNTKESLLNLEQLGKFTNLL